MRFRNDARDVQADAHTRESPGPSRATHERVAELRDFVGWDADPFVCNCDLRLSVSGRQRDAHRSALRRVFHRVANEVHEELLDARLVAMRGHARRRLDRKAVAAVLGGRVGVPLHDLAKYDGEVVSHALHAQGSLLGAGYRQEIVDETIHAIHLSLDGGEVAIERLHIELRALLLGPAHTRADQLSQRFQRRERRPELVRDDRKELLALTLAGQEVGDVVECHDSYDDLAFWPKYGRRAHLELAPLAGVGPLHDDLASALLAPHRSIERLRAGLHRLARQEVPDVHRGAKLGERLELGNAEDFSGTRVRLAAAIRPADHDAVPERVQQMPMELLLRDGFCEESRVRDPDRRRRRQQVRELDVLMSERPAWILGVDLGGRRIITKKK